MNSEKGAVFASRLGPLFKILGDHKFDELRAVLRDQCGSALVEHASREIEAACTSSDGDYGPGTPERFDRLLAALRTFVVRVDGLLAQHEGAPTRAVFSKELSPLRDRAAQLIDSLTAFDRSLEAR